jgi:tetratricopeptide (TPR) repeat protein
VEVKNRDKAIELFARAIKLKPDHDGCLNSLGYLYAEDGIKLDEAKELIERALKEDPDNGAYLDSLGWVYFKKGQYDQALSVLQKADTRLKDPLIYEHMGDVYFRLKKVEDAKKYWKLSLDLLPGQEQIIQKLHSAQDSL